MRQRQPRPLPAGLASRLIRRRKPRRALEGRQIVGFAWYTKAEWSRLRELAADPEALDDDYDHWLRHAESSLAELRSKGVRVQPVPLDVERAAKWSESESRPFNSAARAAFVLELVRKG